MIIHTISSNYAQVEDWLFCVPRFEFVKSSEVFADMFLLPSGPGANTEGRDKDHPIVLEGYKKEEFSCLLKVMYPTYVFLIFFIFGPHYLLGCIQSRISNFRHNTRVVFGKGGMDKCAEIVHNLEYGKGVPKRACCINC